MYRFHIYTFQTMEQKKWWLTGGCFKNSIKSLWNEKALLHIQQNNLQTYFRQSDHNLTHKTIHTIETFHMTACQSTGFHIIYYQRACAAINPVISHMSITSSSRDHHTKPHYYLLSQDSNTWKNTPKKTQFRNQILKSVQLLNSCLKNKVKFQQIF